MFVVPTGRREFIYGGKMELVVRKEVCGDDDE